MLVPARTYWPSPRFTPSRLPALSRPFLLDEPAFLCAMGYSFDSAFLAGLRRRVAGFVGFLAGSAFADADFVAALAAVRAFAGAFAAAFAAGAFGAAAGASSAFTERLPPALISSIRTRTRCCRWPRVRRYVAFCLNLKMMSFGPSASPSTV